jgi:hypothetical protein
MRIEIYSGIELSWRVYKSFTLSHGVLVYVEPSQPQGLLWYRRFFRDCTALFSFFVGSQVYRTSTICCLPPNGGGDESSRDVQAFDQTRSFTLKEIDHPETMPLPFTAIRDVAATVFDRWFSSSNEIGPVYRLLIETLPPIDLTLDTAFLRLSQAVEVLYRRAIKETYVKPDDFDTYCYALIKAFPSGMPENLRSRVKSHLKYANEYSLKSVVKRLLKDLDEPARKALGISDSTEFSRTVANTRNSLTHLSAQEQPLASTAKEYHKMNKQLRALLYGVLAKSLGVSGTALEQCVLRVGAYT